MDTHLRLTRLHHTVQKSSSAAESESLVQNCLRFRHRVEFFFFLHFQKTSEAKGRGTLSSDDYPATTAQRNGIAPPAKWSIKTESRTGEMRDATNCCELCPHRTHTRRTNRKYNRLSYNLWRRTTAAETTTWGVTIGDVTTEHGTHINYGLATAIVDNERRLFL